MSNGFLTDVQPIFRYRKQSTTGDSTQGQEVIHIKVISERVTRLQGNEVVTSVYPGGRTSVSVISTIGIPNFHDSDDGSVGVQSKEYSMVSSALYTKNIIIKSSCNHHIYQIYKVIPASIKTNPFIQEL